MNVFLDMVGCRLNQSEIETYARQLRMAGHTLTPSAQNADLVIINTCTVTSAAASDSRQKIRQSARKGAAQVVVTGCYATLNPLEVSTLPGVSRVINNFDKEYLIPIVLNLPFSAFGNSAIQREPIPGARLRTRAFIKVQDGCDNTCTYCITRLARGAGRSRPIEQILLDIRSAIEGGAKEIVLTGVHLGSWGFDFSEPLHLKNLVKAILDETSIPRLQLSSLEPWDIKPDFFELWQDDRLCRHLHLPLQSGSSATLRRMGRRISPTSYARLISEARQAIPPGLSITTDIITGFPGETDEEFSESADFVQSMNFANGHVFTYSPRPGTAAINLADKVPSKTAKQRNARMRQIFLRSAQEFRLKFINCDLPVLWEKAYQLKPAVWQLSGLSDNYLRVHAEATAQCQNQITNMHITGIEQEALVGDILLS